MIINSIVHFVKRPVVIGLFVFFVLLLLSIILTYQRYLLYKETQARDLNLAANRVKEKMDETLDNSLSATKTLSFIITRYKAANDFDVVAKSILEDNQFIDALELVKGGTITHVYPLKGNETAIGYNIFDDTLRNKEAYKAIEENKLFFAGPIKLKQGYMGIVGRLPIFIDHKFWGFSAVLIKLSTFINAAELHNTQNKDFVFQLSKINPNSGEEEFFLPDSLMFDKSEAVINEVPEGNWKIYVTSARNRLASVLIPVLLLSLLFAITGGLLAWDISRQPYVLKKLVNEKTMLLSKSEETFRILVEQNLVGVFILQDGKFIYTNPEFEKNTGYSKAELLNTVSIEDLVHRDDLEKVKAIYLLLDKGEHATSRYIIKGIRRNKSIMHQEVIVSAIIYNNKPALIGTAIDITSQIEEDKRINKAVTDAQEGERMQLGMELHDNVNQILAASLLNLTYASLNIQDQKLATSVIEQVKANLQEVINEIRQLSHKLTPTVYSSASLEEMIRILVNNMNSSNQLKVSVLVDEVDEPISNELQLTIYRILQEQMNNILKHANASAVAITVQKQNEHIVMVIKDDGVGFDTSVKKYGIGLENINRRVKLMDGAVKIISSPGKGFEVNVEMPLKQV